MDYNTLIVLLGTSLLGACCGLVGTFAVLRRRALIGDALAHAALPGVCIAFLIVGSRHLPSLLTGALVAGLIGTLIITSLRKTSRIKEDAAIGIVLSVFYGLGVVLLARIQGRDDLQSAAGLEKYILGQTAGMIAQDVFFIAGCAVICVAAILLFYKEFKLIAFDTGFATVQGWPAFRLDLLLMTLVALTVVVGLPAVGVILVAAALIIPAAAARFWSDRLGWTLLISATFGAAGGACGSLISAFYPVPAGPAIVLSLTALFAFSLMASPRRGLIARVSRHRQFRRRVLEQQALLDLAGSRAISERARLALVHRGWATASETDAVLTAQGQAEADGLLAQETLWQEFSAQYPELIAEYASFDLLAIEEVPEDLLATLPSAGK